MQDAYLRAWNYRPTRAEPLYAIAVRHRIDGRYALGRLFARMAAEIPLPANDQLFVQADISTWRAFDEQAVCSSWINQWPEAVALWQRVLACADIPPADRQRIAANLERAAAQLAVAAVTDPSLRDPLVRRLLGRAIATGQIRLPAAPSLGDDYEALCLKTFAALGVEFSAEQRRTLRAALDGQLAIAFKASPRSEIVIAFDAPLGLKVNYTITAKWSSIDAAYDEWVAHRQPPYFGTSADARVWALAQEADDPAACPVLDIGAGTGRNALALARRGHPVDAVEISSQFAAVLRDSVSRESLPVRVLERDVFATQGDLRRDYWLVVLSEVVSDFRTTDQLRQMFELALKQANAKRAALLFRHG
ncbi:MAG: class I SAM-dependent methyltransferase, partial [Pirellulales bacterium]